MIGTQPVAYVRDQTSRRALEVRWDIRAGYERDKYFIRISPPTLRDTTASKTGQLPPNAIAFIESDDPRAAEARTEFVKWAQLFITHFERDDFVWHKEHSIGLEKHVSGFVIEEVDSIAIAKRWIVYVFTIALVVYFPVWYIVYSSIGSRHRRVLAGLCPSCSYSLAGVTVQRCPECGLNAVREAKLLRLLRQKGYRGLKQFMKEESAPA